MAEYLDPTSGTCSFDLAAGDSLRQSQQGASDACNETPADQARTTGSFKAAIQPFLSAGIPSSELLPIIPHDAVLSPRTIIKPWQRGKTPGAFTPEGWVGLTTQLGAPLPPVWQRKALAFPTRNVGLRGERFPAVDFDVEDPALRESLEEIAVSTLGPAPIRYRRDSERTLHVYKWDSGQAVKKMRIAFHRNGAEHAVEVLGHGQQYVIAGTHPKRSEYEWQEGADLREWGVDRLSKVNAQAMQDFMSRVREYLTSQGAEFITHTGGRSGGGDERSVALIEPTCSATLAITALRAVPNTQETLPTRDDLVRVLASYKAVRGREAELDRHDVLEWAMEREWCEEDYFNQVWDSIRSVRVDHRVLFKRARDAGWRGDINLDFEVFASHDANVTPAPTTEIECGLADMNRLYAVTMINTGVAIAKFDDQGKPCPNFMNVDAMKVWEKNKTVVRADGRSIERAAVWLSWPGRRQYESVTLQPLNYAGRGPCPDPRALNMWRGFTSDPAEVDGSDWPHIRHYLHQIICAGDTSLNEFVLDWLAQAIQTPWVKPGTALILGGRQGAGKTTITNLLKAIFDARHVVSVSRPDDIVGKFNDVIADALFVVCDEATFAGDKSVANRLKALVTDPTLVVERKNVPAYTAPSFHRFISTSNEAHSVHAESDQRRYVVLEVSDEKVGDHDYFDALHKALTPNSEEVRAFLRDMAVRTVDAKRLRRAPTTTALIRQIVQSLPAPERWLYERLRECVPAEEISSARKPAGDTDGFGFDPMSEWPEYIRKAALRADYGRWAKDQRYLKGNNLRAFGQLLEAFGTETQPRINGLRDRVIELGALQDARVRFSQMFLRGESGPEIWGEDPAEEGDEGEW